MQAVFSLIRSGSYILIGNTIHEYQVAALKERTYIAGLVRGFEHKTGTDEQKRLQREI